MTFQEHVFVVIAKQALFEDALNQLHLCEHQ